MLLHPTPYPLCFQSQRNPSVCKLNECKHAPHLPTPCVVYVCKFHSSNALEDHLLRSVGLVCKFNGWHAHGTRHGATSTPRGTERQHCNNWEKPSTQHNTNCLIQRVSPAGPKKQPQPSTKTNRISPDQLAPRPPDWVEGSWGLSHDCATWAGHRDMPQAIISAISETH